MSTVKVKATLMSLDLGGRRSPGSARFESDAGHVIKIDSLTSEQTETLRRAFNEPDAFTVTFEFEEGEVS